MAHETIREHRHSVHSDVYSFGALIFEVFSFGQIPFARIDDGDIMRHLMRGIRLPLDMPEWTPPALANLAFMCTDPDAKLRLGFAEMAAMTAPDSEEQSEQASAARLRNPGSSLKAGASLSGLLPQSNTNSEI